MPARDGAVTSALGRGRDRKACHALRRRVLSRRSPRPPSVACSCWGSSPPTREQGGHLRSGPPSAGRAPWPAAPAQPRPLRHRGQFPGSLASGVVSGEEREGQGISPVSAGSFHWPRPRLVRDASRLRGPRQGPSPRPHWLVLPLGSNDTGTASCCS